MNHKLCVFITLVSLNISCFKEIPCECANIESHLHQINITSNNGPKWKATGFIDKHCTQWVCKDGNKIFKQPPDPLPVLTPDAGQ